MFFFGMHVGQTEWMIKKHQLVKTPNYTKFLGKLLKRAKSNRSYTIHIHIPHDSYMIFEPPTTECALHSTV